ncbi:MAG: class I SAM-dependent methyltransferase [Defluviitaleaceae bacterium]|nr:class I SAM-dependent methyltransferase [Defluviitaleaceae bacterium]
MFNNLMKYTEKPQLYTPSTNSLWNDEHISKGMLEAHLHPNWDAATRNHKFIEESVKWIAKITPPSEFNNLLDLGCGPGLYAERFAKVGYAVTGIDFSERSVEYAKKQAILSGSNISYHYKNYLTLDYTEQFDVITLIYCDYAPLSINDRLTLLKVVYKALKPNGKFVLDVFTPKMRKAEKNSWSNNKSGSFYSEKPHICLERTYQYDDDDNTELDSIVVITDEKIECYNIWNHYFTKEMLIDEIMPTGFSQYEFYGDVAGHEYSENGETICGIFTK